MPKSMSVIDSALLPHPRPCWCATCQREYNRIYQRTRTYPVYLKVCVMCGDQFASKRLTRSFCSEKCRTRSVTRIGYCVEPGCNASYPRKGKRRRCDEHLKPMWRPGNKKSRTVAACKWCLQSFSRIADHESVVCCGTRCLESLKAHRRRYGVIDRSIMPLCVVCNERTFKHPRGLYCQQHRRRASEQKKVLDGRNNLKNAKRRSAAHDGDPGITVVKLRDRDGDHCRYCGFKIDFDAGQYEDLAPEIDHVVPLAAGGTHTWDNVQLLHGRCNRAKGARLIPDRPTLFDEGIA